MIQADRLCAACAETVGVAGAGVAVRSDAAGTTLPASNRVAERIEDLQFALGEGPGVDAHMLGRPVLEPDLGRPSPARWPVFSALALAEGAASLFSYPLRIGAVRMGALTMYRTRPGGLTETQHSDAISMAGLVLRFVLAMQAEAPPGRLAIQLAALDDGRAEVHEAAGMVSVQLAVTVAEALVRLRARAFSDERPLAALAADVVARRVRFTT